MWSKRSRKLIIDIANVSGNPKFRSQQCDFDFMLICTDLQYHRELQFGNLVGRMWKIIEIVKTSHTKVLHIHSDLATVSSRLCRMADSSQGRGTKGDEDARHPSSTSAFSFSRVSFCLHKKKHRKNSKT